YSLRGTPTLVVRDLVARQPGAAEPVLRAGRVYLSLRWSTLRSRGADLTLERVELDAPRLDLGALQRWRASRPPSGEVRIPTLTGGLHVVRGEVIGAGWSVDRIAISYAVFCLLKTTRAPQSLLCPRPPSASRDTQSYI